jgi:hypothetical protein
LDFFDIPESREPTILGRDAERRNFVSGCSGEGELAHPERLRVSDDACPMSSD